MECRAAGEEVAVTVRGGRGLLPRVSLEAARARAGHVHNVIRELSKAVSAAACKADGSASG